MAQATHSQATERYFRAVLGNIQLEAASGFLLVDFFKTKETGGMFTSIDPLFFAGFGPMVPDSPKRLLTASALMRTLPDHGLDAHLKEEGSYDEDLCIGHLRQMCEKGIAKGEKLWSAVDTNIVLVRDKDGLLARLTLQFIRDGWHLYRARPDKGMANILWWWRGTRVFH
ncbi:MAG: hypothetical protein WDN09_03410 [bacterium]